jgi:hypothetical protein
MPSANLRGSCICGSVSYEITGEPRSFFHCHCGRCRKSTGTGHASNIILKPESAVWVSGQELLGTFKVPDAERFRTVFCSKCGSPMPRVAPDLSVAVIPAGSLDSPPPLAPTDHIMWDSRSDWSCEAVDIPTWRRYPE